jgi:cell division protein FtsZ
MFKKADEVLYSAVKGISDLIMKPGLINRDFADVKTVMSASGLAMMGSGTAKGESRARDAAMRAITSPLLEDVSIDGARRVLVNITADLDLTLEEVTEAMSTIQGVAHRDAQVLFGTALDATAGEEIRITVIATGIDPEGAETTPPQNPGPPRGRKTFDIDRASPSDQSSPPKQARGDIWSLFSDEERDKEPAKDRITKYYSGNAHEPAHSEQKLLGNFFRPALQHRALHAKGEDSYIYSEDEFELPAFIRQQAD